MLLFTDGRHYSEKVQWCPLEVKIKFLIWLLLSLCLFLAFCVWCVFGSWHVLCPLYSPFFSVTCTFPDCHISVSCVHLICPACLSLLLASLSARNTLPVSDYSVWISGSETIFGLWPLLYHFCIWLNDGKSHYIHPFLVFLNEQKQSDPLRTAVAPASLF